MLVVRDKELKIILEQLVKVEEKIEGAEEKVMDDTINRATYKKWMKKYLTEQALLLDRKGELEVDLEDFINQETLVLPYLLNLTKIFEDASINQQHVLRRGRDSNP